MSINKILLGLLLVGPFLQAEDDLIALTPKQIQDAGISTKIVSPIRLKVMASLPAKITINETNQAHVVAKVSGTVSEIVRTVGDHVTEGEVLAMLDSKEMAEAKAAYLTALKRADLAVQTLAAEDALKGKKISSEQDYLHTALAAKEAQINLEVALQQLYVLGMSDSEIEALDGNLASLRQLALKSPITGVVIARNITRGSQVSADQDAYTIADLDTVWIELGLYPTDLNKIKPGNQITINSLKGDCPSSVTTIDWVSPTIDEETKRASCTAILPNKNQTWCPGSYVCADIVIEEIQVRQAVLKEAIQEIEGEKFIFVPHAEGFAKRAVEVGRSDNQYVEIVSGIKVGEPYAATQTFLLKAEHGKASADLD